MNKPKKPKVIWPWMIIAVLPSLACLISNPAGSTAIPVGPPEDFEIQTATPTSSPEPVVVEPTAIEEEGAAVRLLGDAPTHTPDPNLPTATATLVVVPTDTPTAVLEEPTATPEPTEVITQTAEITPPPAAPVVSTKPTSEPAPPLQGGDWDFEAEFIPWGNPYGEPCPGARVASGWSPFVEEGPYGSSCLNENLYQPNVFSGPDQSQEITFDFISAHSGIYRTIDTQPQHRYNIVAYAKHDRSLSPVEMSLGIDLSGGTIWNEETVQWFPWDDGAEDTWTPTEETVTATGERMTIFIKGVHPLAEQGGKTVIDNVSVTDLGP